MELSQTSFQTCLPACEVQRSQVRPLTLKLPLLLRCQIRCLELVSHLRILLLTPSCPLQVTPPLLKVRLELSHFSKSWTSPRMPSFVAFQIHVRIPLRLLIRSFLLEIQVEVARAPIRAILPSLMVRFRVPSPGHQQAQQVAIVLILTSLELQLILTFLICSHLKTYLLAAIATSWSVVRQSTAHESAQLPWLQFCL